jgi:hypothetical protein
MTVARELPIEDKGDASCSREGICLLEGTPDGFVCETEQICVHSDRLMVRRAGDAANAKG